MNAAKKYKLIEKYLEHKMSSIEREQFEEQIKNDPGLKEELELHRQMGTTLKGEKIHELRSVLKDVDENWVEEKSNQKSMDRTINFRRIFAVAATVMLLVLAYQFFFSDDSVVSGEQLFADNFQPYQMLLSQRNLSIEEKNVVLENAISTYSKGDFDNASKSFQQLSLDDPEDISYQFYQAVAALGAEDSENAIASFKKIVSTTNHPFMEQSRWYLSLAYLQLGDVENAKKTLNKIQSGQFKYEETQQILRLNF